MDRLSLILCDLNRNKICDLYDNTQFRARNIVQEFSINEISTLSFTLPVIPNGKWLKIKNEQLILFDGEYFKIKNLSFKHDDGGKLYLDVETHHFSDNLAMDLISISEQTPLNVVSLMKVALCYDENDQPTLGWKVGEVTVDRVAVRGLEALEQSPFSILLTIAEKFDGILKFNSQTMTVDMLERQSTTRPTLDLRVSKNLKNFSIKYDTSEMYTRLYCYGATDENGITLDITSVNPTGKGYIDNFEYFKTIGYTEEFINSHPELFVSTNIWKDDNYYDPTDLYNDGIKELAKIAVPIVDVSISALDTKAIGLSDELTKLDLGACIRIYDEDLGVDTLCNVTKRKIDYEKPYILDATVTNSVTYHDTLSKLFTDVNTVSNVVTSGGSIIGGGTGGGVSMDEVKEYLNVYYLNAEQIEAKYASIDELHANYATIEYLKAHYIDAESIAAGYATIGQLHAIEAKIENLDVDYINGKLAEFEKLYADMAEFKDLVANSAEIDEIKAGELTVYGTLKATNAEVENLKATSITTGEFEAYKATIEQLFALYASIEYLEANYLKAQQIEATYAKITSLDAVSATIDNLKAQVANVETLVAEKASIEDLNAVKADIETINAKLINVDKILADVITTDELNAEIAKINKLITDEINTVNATITSLDAKFATIEQLNTEIANVNKLIANKATIEDLNAAKAQIGELDAQLANIDAILSGSIGTGTLQTIHLTAKNVVIDDAVISDLIAAKISVDQLKAGIISTNKFQVQSDDGGFKVVGNTTQWTDSNGKVRMQAGRDAEGNFNFAVFGADGTTRYFDETGIHEAGIPDGIIRDDMVADDANIQASKIQYVDKDGNKTLQTILDIQQGQIDALIKETTIDGDSLKDKFTQLEATVNGLNVTVGEVESSIDSINSKVTQLEVTTEGLKTTVTQAGTDSKEAKTIAEQTAEKFTWIVKSGTNETNFELTDRTATLVAEQINLKGLVKFEGLDSSAQDMITNGYKIGTGNPYQGEAYNYGIGIRKVKGKTSQKTTNGYQLFDASKVITKSMGGATLTNNNDGSFTVSGSGTVSELFVVNYDITGDAAKSFFKAGRVKTVLSNVRPYFYFSFRHSGGIYGDVDSKSHTNFDLTDEMINSDGFFVRCGFQLPQGNEIVNGTIKPMVYQDGDGTWEEFTGGKPAPNPDYPMPIENVEISNITSHGRQLFDSSKISNKTQGGATLTNNNDGSFTVSGSGTVSELFVVNYDITGDAAKALFKAGRVKTALSNVKPHFYFSFRHSGGIYGDVDSNSYPNFDLTDEMINSDGFYVRCGFQLSQGKEIISGTIKPMVYQDGDGTWEEFHGNTVQTSLTLAQDDIYQQGTITRARKQAVFDGSSDESWWIEQTTFRPTINVLQKLIKRPTNNQYAVNMKCNRIKVVSANDTYLKTEGISVDTDGRLQVYLSAITSLDTWKTWLQSHPLVVEYELATPTTEELEIPTVPSYYPYTEVYIDSDVEPTDVEWNINTASNSALTIINNWTKDAIVNGTTTINGGYIKTQTIKTDQLAVNEIFATGSSVMNIINAQQINADRITSGTIDAKFLSVYGLRVLQKDTDLETLSITDQGDITMRGSVESYNYVSGKTGWSIRNDGDAEFNDVTVRGNVITNDGGIVSSGGSGRNLFLWSGRYSENSPFIITSKNGDNYVMSFDGHYIYTTKSFHTGDVISIQAISNLPWIKYHISGDTNMVGFWLYLGTLEQVSNGRYTSPIFLGGDGISKEFKETYKIPTVGDLDDIYIGFRFNTYSDGVKEVTGKFWNLKLEEGDVITPWSTPPEDNIKQVRFWAGTSYEQRESAPFKVYSDGSVEATQGTYSGVWTGDIRVGNISIIDPSSSSGGDAVFTIRNGQNGINNVELTDTDHSIFRQNVYISNNANNTMISLSQSGSIVANTSITVGTTKKVIIDDDSINIDGSTLSNVGDKLSINAPSIDIGSIGSTTPIGINGNATVMGILKAVGEVNFNDVIVCKTSSNGIDFNFKE